MMSGVHDSRSSDGNRCNYKVGRVLEEYDLTELDADLVDMWLGEGPGESYSLRELSEHINKHLLRTAMERAGIDPLDGEIEETYRLLRADDISDDIRQKVVHRLKREGVNVDELEEDFVTHQAVHTYLTKFRGGDPEARESTEPLTGQGLLDELSGIAAEALESAREEGEVEIGNFRLDIELQVYCNECAKTYSLEELFDEGGCRCKTVATL